MAGIRPPSDSHSLRRCAPTQTADPTHTYQSVSLPQITDRDQIVFEEVGQLTSCGEPWCSPLRPTSRREATRASHGRNTANACLPRTEAGEANSPRQRRPRCGGRSRRFYRCRRTTPASGDGDGGRAIPPVTPRPRAAPVRRGREEKEASHPTREARQEGKVHSSLG